MGLRCFSCGTWHQHDRWQGLCRSCGLPLRAEYDLGQFEVDEDMPSLWRYRGVLPIVGGEVSLVEGLTPLLQVEENIWVKDEARNPTGSFKARGMSVAVSMARALGAEHLAAPSAGNAAGALAAYGAAAGLAVTVALPEATRASFVEECRHYGAQVHLVPGTIADAGDWLRRHGPAGALDVSTMREPYRVEGKKTMGYELVEQLRGIPDVVVYPTGGGTGLVGMWKAFDELQALGWMGAERPRLVAVQAEGCAPVVRAFEKGEPSVRPWEGAETSALGLRVPFPIGGFLCLRALRETGGRALAVPEAGIWPAAGELAAHSGIDACPEAGAAWAGTRMLLESGWLSPGERVVVFNTGTGLKYRQP